MSESFNEALQKQARLPRSEAAALVFFKYVLLLINLLLLSKFVCYLLIGFQFLQALRNVGSPGLLYFRI